MWPLRALRAPALLAALAPACADSESPATRVPLDLTHNDSAHQLPEYRAEVARLDLDELGVAQPSGAPNLFVGHPASLSARITLDAEPLDAPLFVGLRNADDAFCVLGELGVEHLLSAFDEASRANRAIAAHDPAIDPGSLADCAASQKCAAANETCVGLVGSEVPDGYDPDAAVDPSATPEVPSDTDTDTAVGQAPVVWQCMRPSYAAQLVVDAEARPLVVTPADLAGQVEHEYALHAEVVVPEACAALIGAGPVEAWASFNPDWVTHFPDREGGQDETHVDIDPDTAAAETAPVDREAERGARAYASRSRLTTPIGGELRADPGIDVELHRIVTGSAVVALHEDVVQPWDFDVTAVFSIDGDLGAQAAALATAREDFIFTVRPFGDPRSGCTADDTADLAPAPLGITDPSGSDHADALVDLLAERTVKEHGFALHVAGDTRTRIVSGDWACWDHFEVRGCFTTDLAEADAPGMGTDNNCATLELVFERVLPELGESGLPKDASHADQADFDFKSGALAAGQCDQNLLKEYTTQMKRYFELERSVKISNWYVMDYGRYLSRLGVGDNWDYAPYSLPTNWFSNHIARSPWIGGHVEKCTSYFEANGTVGGDDCYNIKFINNDANAYRRLRRYYLSDDGRGGDYVSFQRDAFAHTNGWYEYACQGIHSGAIFNAWGSGTVARLKGWHARWVNPDPIHAQYDVTARPTDALTAGGSGGRRCGRFGLYMLHRYRVEADGSTTLIDDDDAYWTQYLPRIAEKAAAKARADQIWQQLLTSCTAISAPAWSSELISQTRLVPALYPSKSVSFGSVNLGAEGGILNDALVNKTTGEFVLTAGPQVRLWLDGTLAPSLGGGIELRLYDLFRAWIIGRFYSDVVSSYLSAGFHVLTYDLWKLKYKLPDQFLIPMPPPIEKEKERCRSFFYAPVPVGVELCVGIGGALGIKGDGPNDAATLTVEKVGTTAGSGGRPGIVGKVIPFVAIKSSGSIGLDFLAGVAGFRLNLDPTIELQFPIEPSLHWSLRWLSQTNRIAWELVPGIRVGFDVVGFGGNLQFQLKWRFRSPQGWTIVDWDPLDLASETLLERSVLFSGETSF
ncbi:MAG: hypothetical protein JNJ59_10060 [Deltaproteobacteria bacterium]|nr:hypothetical protein [Deltaproteobacteria bacterium]